MTSNMTKRYRRGVIVGLTAGLAGCGGLLPGPEELSGTSTTESDGPATPKQEETNTGLTRDSETDYPTSDVLLSVPEMDDGYTLTGESYQVQSSADQDELERLRKAEIVRQHERSFRLETTDDSRASVVFSSVTVYESADVATNATDELLNSIRDNGGSIEEQNILSGISASMATFENNEGDSNTLFLRRSGQVQYYVVTSDQAGYFQDQTRDLFVQMVTATPD
jgi:cation transport regulator ChaC